MNRPAIEPFLLSRDPDWLQMLRGYLAGITTTREYQSLEEIEYHLRASEHFILLLDLRFKQPVDLLQHLLEQFPESQIICFGDENAKPFQQAKNLPVYAAETLFPTKNKFHQLYVQVVDYYHTKRELKAAESSAQTNQIRKDLILEQQASIPNKNSLNIQHFTHTSRHVSDINQLYSRLLEGIESSMRISRAGIIAKEREEETYTFKAGLRHLKETEQLSFPKKHPFIQFLSINTHVISRSYIEQIPNPADKQLLKEQLNLMGAEIILPLFATGEIIGWLYMGHRVSGKPYTEEDLDDLGIVAEHFCTTLENAILYEESIVQRTLATTLLSSIPSGIIAIDQEKHILWFNQSAESLLGQDAKNLVGKHCKELGGHLSSILLESMESGEELSELRVMDLVPGKCLDLQSSLLTNDDQQLGAMLSIIDKTREMEIVDEEKRMERAKFWTELAAAMSHEIRNPLVTIKTFAQLLPERFDEDDFRLDFSEQVNSEADRLNAIIDQINDFANPPDTQFTTVNISSVIDDAIARIKENRMWKDIKFIKNIEDDLPVFRGDENALINCIYCLFENSAEAATETNKEIIISANRLGTNGNTRGILLAIKDFGHGLNITDSTQLFSPFYTTKARGLGLGLPIAKRTLLDHDGTIQLDARDDGTVATIFLPAKTTEGKKHEEYINS